MVRVGATSIPPPVRTIVPDEPDDRWWWWTTDRLTGGEFYDWYFCSLRSGSSRLHLSDYPYRGLLGTDLPEMTLAVRAALVEMAQGTAHAWD